MLFLGRLTKRKTLFPIILNNLIKIVDKFCHTCQAHLSCSRSFFKWLRMPPKEGKRSCLTSFLRDQDEKMSALIQLSRRPTASRVS